MTELAPDKVLLAKATAYELVARCLLSAMASHAPDPQAFLRQTAEMVATALRKGVAGACPPDALAVIETGIEDVFVNAQKATFDDLAARLAKDFPLTRA